MHDDLSNEVLGNDESKNELRASSKRTRVPRFYSIFVGDDGLRAGWSVLLFVMFFMLMNRGMRAVLDRFPSLTLPNPITPGIGILQEGCTLLVILAATAVMAAIEGRRVADYGYAANDKIKRLASGAGIGFACLSVLVGVLWAAGFLVFDGRDLGGFAALEYGVIWAFGFVVVGLVEESLLRGYLQFTLARGVGFWWAALILSVLFALGHLGNSGESRMGLVAVFVGGLVFSLCLWYTKSLWWGIGFHAGWDWAQSYFYGTPDSGLLVADHFLKEHAVGRTLWSGGTVGPEGSLFLFPVLLLVAFGMWMWWGRGGRAPNTDPTA
jgi:uncharacterized protein